MNTFGAEQPLEFPVTCRHRILADKGEDVRAHILMRLHELRIEDKLEEGRHSRKGNYVTYTVEVEYHSRDELYRVMNELSNIWGVRTVI